jgi:hypothetical protein
LRCGRGLSLGCIQRPQGPQYDPSETHQQYDIEEEKRELGREIEGEDLV